MSERAKNPVKSTVTTFQVLDALMELDGCRVTELATHLDLPKSTVHNYLRTLVQEEYVYEDGGEYHIGLPFLEYGIHARNKKQVHDIAAPEIERLAEETGELVNLVVEEHGWGIYIGQEKGSGSVSVDSDVGTRVYLHCTALGKAILAHLPEERVDEILERRGMPEMTERTLTRPEDLKATFETVRERGYAVDDEERLEGLRCLSAPILNTDDGVLGAISVSGPAYRMQGEYFEDTIPTQLLETANIVELNITYS